MEKLLMRFQNGGSVKVVLMEKEAPNTIKAITKLLPLKVKLLNARFAGEAIFFTADIGEVVNENQRIDKEKGLLSLHMGSSGFAGKAVHIFYGDKIASKHAENIFGRVETNLDELKTIGERIWTEGPEYVDISLLDE